MKTWELVGKLLSVNGTRLVDVSKALMEIRRGNGKRKPSNIKIAIEDADIDRFFDISNTLATDENKAVAFVVISDLATVKQILREA